MDHSHEQARGQRGLVVHDETRRLTEQGKVAWRQLRDESRKNFDRWWIIGAAISAARSDIMIYIGKNEPKGSAYNHEMGLYLKDTGFDEIHPTMRHFLQRCIDNAAAVRSWHASLDLSTRLRYNNPKTVWRRFQASIKDSEVMKQNKVSYKDKAMQLQEELEALQFRVEQAEAQADELKQQRADELERQQADRLKRQREEELARQSQKKLTKIFVTTILRPEKGRRTDTPARKRANEQMREQTRARGKTIHP